MTARECLVAARKKIEDPAHWTQRAFARDKNGTGVSPFAQTACQFCALGAVLSCSAGRMYDEPSGKQVANNVLARLAESKGFNGVGDFNDSTNHEAVMRLFDEAILGVGGDR